MKKWDEWSKKQKVILGVVSVGIVIGGAGSFKAYENYQYKEQVSQAKVELNKEFTSLDELKTTVDSLRDKENPNYLTKEVSLTEIETIETQLEKLKSKHETTSLIETKELNQKVMILFSEVKNNTDSIQYQLDVQDDVNSLFSMDKEVAITGSEIKLDLPIADDLTAVQIEEVINENKNKNMLAIIPLTTDEKKSWEKSITSLTDKASEQVKQIEEATKKVNAFFKDDKPVDTTDSKKITEVEKEIGKIKNAKAKKALTGKLKKVSDVVAKKEKEVAETKAKETASANAAVSNQGQTASNNNGATGEVQTDSYVDAQDNSNNQTYSEGNTSNYTPSNNGGSGSSNNNYTAPNTGSNGGGGTSSGGSSSAGGGGTWSGSGNVTGGGEIDPGKDGSATWTGGDFDGSDIPDW